MEKQRNGKYGTFDGMRFSRRNAVHSLKSARAHAKKYSEEGFMYRIEKEGHRYVVYTRKRV